MMSSPAVSRMDCSGEMGAFPGTPVFPDPEFLLKPAPQSRIQPVDVQQVSAFIIVLGCNYHFFARVKAGRGVVAFVCNFSFIHSYKRKTARWSAVLIESSSLNCDNSICSAS